MFVLKAPFSPQGDQPKAIAQVERGFVSGMKRQVLLGATGTGKTFTMAQMIARLQRPTLVLCHNKTLAAQLWAELQGFFPENAVEYFISYYDYYQPESYVPERDLYIEKDTSVNEKIERMRLSAAHSLATRDDVIIVASVSCIYGLGDPDEFSKLVIPVSVRQRWTRGELIARLIAVQYQRNDLDIKPGRFRVRGDTIDIIPGYDEKILRISLFGDVVESISEHASVSMDKLTDLASIRIFPARNYVFSDPKIERALHTIKEELESVLPTLGMLEAHRLKQRTDYDLEMIKEMGFCTGIENYSRHFDGRNPGEPPYTLIDFFPKDFLMIIDESHVSVPQVHGMWKGDRSRKKNLIDYGFRLPSAFDNRPLTFEEFDAKLDKVLYVSATPGDYELGVSSQVVEQIIRPTGLLDPLIEVKGTDGQIPDLVEQATAVIASGYRVLVTTLTKRMAEHLTDYLGAAGLKVRYLHSEIDTIERTEIIRQLRAGVFDILVGINLLREGIDIPEVALVAILDADKEGFLRNARSLIQTIGRAARNTEGRVIMYADKMTESMERAIAETNRRRAIQESYNKEHGVVPRTIIKPVPDAQIAVKDVKSLPRSDLPALIVQLQSAMEQAAENLEFERAIQIRDQIREYERRL